MIARPASKRHNQTRGELERAIHDYDRRNALFAAGIGVGVAGGREYRERLEADLAKLEAAEHGPADITRALASAQAFRVAIDALPVGRDIRTRLLAHLDAHIAAIEAMR